VTHLVRQRVSPQGFAKEAKRNAAGIVAQQRSHGWQIYVTNSPADKLSLAEAVLAYRQTPTFERGFSRLKNRPLGLRPLYLV
jgi:transposase